MCDHSSVSFKGIKCKPFSPSGVLLFKEKHDNLPWYKIKDNGNGTSEIDMTDKNGVRVSFSIFNNSESMKNILACDPFGENLFEVVKNK